MSGEFNCPACGGRIAAESPAGTSVRCPLCQEVVTVPQPGLPPTVPGAPYVPGFGAPAAPVKQGLAVGALICGILGLCLAPIGLIGVVLGIVALVKAGNEPHRYGGKGMAIGGICTGAVSIILVPLTIAIVLPSLSRARELSKRLVCGANMKGIGTALKIYSLDSYGQYPPDLQVLFDQGGFTEQQFWCPSSDADPGDIHACYMYIPGQSEGNDDSRNVLLYEKPENHKEGGNVLFHDGHVEFIKPYSRVLELVAETEARIAERRAREAADPRAP